MRYLTKEFMSLFGLLIVVFLILTHDRGFARGVSAIGSNVSHVARTFQGR
jgi:hypothetical protein